VIYYKHKHQSTARKWARCCLVKMKKITTRIKIKQRTAMMRMMKKKSPSEGNATRALPLYVRERRNRRSRVARDEIGQMP